jgi:phosphinothricin acetyltransferase
LQSGRPESAARPEAGGTARHSTIELRDASLEDLPGILAIYNEIIATSTAIYALEPTTLGERRRWFDARIASGYPVLVAVREGRVLGFSSFGDWRGTWPGYRYTVEHTVHVHSEARRAGVGRRLLEALIPRALAMDKHVMLGGIDAENQGSIQFHERLGFTPVAHFREVGHKFGRWLDLVFVQRLLDAAGSSR